MNTKKTAGAVVLVVLLAIAGVIIVMAFGGKKTASAPAAAVAHNVPDILHDGRQCYSYRHDATADAPYWVSERIDMTVAGNSVTGTKTGTQNGPEMTNGYQGTLVGTRSGDTLDMVFSYVVEGSHNQEQEIYTVLPNQIGIEKLRYPLVEKNGMLVPDTTQPFSAMMYSRVGCDASD